MFFYLSPGQTVRPKSQCEQHRDSLQSGVEQGGRPSLGAFIPQCDSDGQYRPLQVSTDWQTDKVHNWLMTWVKWRTDFGTFNNSLQCHGSTGHCWCVDSRGQERAGTRTPPGTAPRDCDRPGEIYTHWQKHINIVSKSFKEWLLYGNVKCVFKVLNHFPRSWSSRKELD